MLVNGLSLIKRRIKSVLVVGLCCLYLLGCTTIATKSQPMVTPVGVQKTVHRAAIIVQFCSDVTTSYPREDFQRANQLIANSLAQAVRPDQDGVTLYATAITHNTFDPANTLDPPFVVPAIGPYPAFPTPVPTAKPLDPVSDSATATAIASKNSVAVTAYNQAVQATVSNVQGVQKSVTGDVARLNTWNPPADNTATSIYGCLELARDRFNGHAETKLLYIASDLENNTNVDETNTLEASQGLKGAIVHMIFFYSESAARRDAKVAIWCPLMRAAGATAVLFDDPSTSLDLPNMFDQDAQTQPQPCPAA